MRGCSIVSPGSEYFNWRLTYAKSRVAQPYRAEAISGGVLFPVLGKGTGFRQLFEALSLRC